MQVAFRSRARGGAEHCGDAGAYWKDDEVTIVCVVDGLGHGLHAEIAANAALNYVGEHRSESLDDLLRGCDLALRDTRGVALSLAVVHRRTLQLTYVGVGNIRALVVGERSFRLTNSAGIVGGGFKKLHREMASLHQGDVLVLTTDGVSREMDPGPPSILRQRSPSEVVHNIVNTYGLDNDDAAALLLRADSADADMSSFSQRYYQLMHAHLSEPREWQLAEAADLGKELVEAEIPTDEIMELHENALHRLIEDGWDPEPIHNSLRTASPLLETLMAYGLAFRRQVALKEAAQQASLAKEAAERANRAKSDFLAHVSHEIRTPMSGIIGMAELLRQSTLSEDAREQIDTILTSAETLLRIINDILDFSKIEAGKLELEAVAFSVRGTVTRTINLLQPRARAKGITLRVDIADDVPDIIHGDPTRLSQVLLNLLGNAVKFTLVGHVTVRVHTIRDHHRQAGQDELRFEVVDTGVGISSEVLPRLFAPFIQGRPSTARRFGGTGLGLAISQRLVALMGGTLEASSAIERGSTFSFAMPFSVRMTTECDSLRATNHETEADDMLALARAPSTYRILVADDNEINRRVACMHLQRMGFETRCVSDGREVLQALEHERYALVMLDCEMPGMDGYEATKYIRAHEPPGQRTPIVAVTAHALREIRSQCLEAGMDDYLAKPFRQSELRNVLARWLE